MTERFHYSSQPELTPKDISPIGTANEIGKPTGLWYSLGTEWEEWKNENMPFVGATYRFSLDVSCCNILFLTTPQDILNFGMFYPSTRSAREPQNRGIICDAIDWAAVAQNYDGIEIAPYC